MAMHPPPGSPGPRATPRPSPSPPPPAGITASRPDNGGDTRPRCQHRAPAMPSRILSDASRRLAGIVSRICQLHRDSGACECLNPATPTRADEVFYECSHNRWLCRLDLAPPGRLDLAPLGGVGALVGTAWCGPAWGV